MNTTKFLERARSTSPAVMARWCKQHPWVNQLKHGHKEELALRLHNPDMAREAGIIIANYAPHSLFFELSPYVRRSSMLAFFIELLEQNDFDDLKRMGGDAIIDNIFDKMKYIRGILAPGISELENYYLESHKPEVKEFIFQLYVKQWKYTIGGKPSPIIPQEKKVTPATGFRK